MANFDAVDFSPDAYGVLSNMDYGGMNFAEIVEELKDNSHDAGAKNLDIFLIPSPDNKTLGQLVVLDDGRGMAPTTLFQACRMAAQMTHSSNDIGKFGMGMKNATMAAGRLITIFTKTSEHGMLGLIMDIDQMKSERTFKPTHYTDDASQLSWALPSELWKTFSGYESGTLILVRNLKDTFARPVTDVIKELFRTLNLAYMYTGHRITNLHIGPIPSRSSLIMTPVDMFYRLRPDALRYVAETTLNVYKRQDGLRVMEVLKGKRMSGTTWIEGSETKPKTYRLWIDRAQNNKDYKHEEDDVPSWQPIQIRVRFISLTPQAYDQEGSQEQFAEMDQRRGFYMYRNERLVASALTLGEPMNDKSKYQRMEVVFPPVLDMEMGVRTQKQMSNHLNSQVLADALRVLWHQQNSLLTYDAPQHSLTNTMHIPLSSPGINTLQGTEGSHRVPIQNFYRQEIRSEPIRSTIVPNVYNHTTYNEFVRELKPQLVQANPTWSSAEIIDEMGKLWAIHTKQSYVSTPLASLVPEPTLVEVPPMERSSEQVPANTMAQQPVALRHSTQSYESTMPRTPVALQTPIQRSVSRVPVMPPSNIAPVNVSIGTPVSLTTLPPESASVYITTPAPALRTTSRPVDPLRTEAAERDYLSRSRAPKEDPPQSPAPRGDPVTSVENVAPSTPVASPRPVVSAPPKQSVPLNERVKAQQHARLEKSTSSVQPSTMPVDTSVQPQTSPYAHAQVQAEEPSRQLPTADKARSEMQACILRASLVMNNARQQSSAQMTNLHPEDPFSANNPEKYTNSESLITMMANTLIHQRPLLQKDPRADARLKAQMEARNEAKKLEEFGPPPLEELEKTIKHQEFHQAYTQKQMESIRVGDYLPVINDMPYESKATSYGQFSSEIQPYILTHYPSLTKDHILSETNRLWALHKDKNAALFAARPKAIDLPQQRSFQSPEQQRILKEAREKAMKQAQQQTFAQSPLPTLQYALEQQRKQEKEAKDAEEKRKWAEQLERKFAKSPQEAAYEAIKISQEPRRLPELRATPSAARNNWRAATGAVTATPPPSQVISRIPYIADPMLPANVVASATKTTRGARAEAAMASSIPNAIPFNVVGGKKEVDWVSLSRALPKNLPNNKDERHLVNAILGVWNGSLPQ